MERSSPSSGMGLLEAVVWVAVFTSAMLALTSSVLYFYRTSNYAIQQGSATASAQRGIDLMIRTIREASYASNGAYPIVSMGNNDLKFYSEIDGDPAIERVHYYFSGTALVKGVIDPTGDPAVYSGVETISTTSEDVRNVAQGTSLFSYYDKNGALLSDLTKIGDVRYISATLLVDVDPVRSPTPLSLRSSAAMRNLIGK
ncbi:hypothetical protein HY971_03120 [Candidatus Kaiserbacteria bacterium]|nr:hypothetical protein [Candidatus Kaiserbacteria bacterium]